MPIFFDGSVLVKVGAQRHAVCWAPFINRTSQITYVY